jgi:hypothetical protein
MHFPSYIETTRNKGKRAQLRLKYMLSIAMLRTHGRPSIHLLAQKAGCDHSSIFNAINRGYFTEPMAQAIESVVGRNELQKEWLVSPLEVNEVTQ